MLYYLSFKNIFKKKYSALSFIEVAIVILIIGIIIAAVFAGRNIITKAQMKASHALTNASPIRSIPGNVLWLESAMTQESLGENIATGDNIARWNSIAINSSYTQITKVGNGPIYANTISDIPAIRFGSDSSNDYLQIEDASFLNGTDYSIFILDKRMDVNAGVGNYLLGESGSFALGYETAVKIIQSHGEDASENNQANITALSHYSNAPRVITFTHSSSAGNKIYINATLANEDTSDEAKTHLYGITSLPIGKGYNGEIGELVIFTKALKTSDIASVEDYLSKKWDAPNNRGGSSSCTSGTVTAKGCESTCSVAIDGVLEISVPDGDVGTFPCNASSKYDSSDEISYSCSNGILSISGDAICGCNSDNGYALESGVCVKQCIVPNGTEGVADGTILDKNDSTIDCNEANYSGSLSYSCDSEGNATITDNSCTRPSCSGGAESTITIGENTYTIHVFSSSGSLVCEGNLNAQILVVGGGGGGGGVIGGGGGAGGLVYNDNYDLVSATYSVVVGNGGGGGRSYNNAQQGGKLGQDSEFDELGVTLNITASGGGAGGYWGGSSNSSNNDTSNGGSGGGGGNASPAGTAVSGQGNNGTAGNFDYGGGGGGAGSAASAYDTVNKKAGNGGAGADYSSIFGTSVGDSGWFASGGGGGIRDSVGGTAGIASNGGGGNATASTSKAEDGMNNTGGGGGGAGFSVSSDSVFGGTGGSGVVIIRY